MGSQKRTAVTPDEVKEFYHLYEKHGSYTEVAQITGRSASTIGRYVGGGKAPKAMKYAINQTIVR